MLCAIQIIQPYSKSFVFIHLQIRIPYPQFPFVFRLTMGQEGRVPVKIHVLRDWGRYISWMCDIFFTA